MQVSPIVGQPIASQTVPKFSYFCPICALEFERPVEGNRLEIYYKVKGKQEGYTTGFNACVRCLIGAEKCLKQYMQNRIDRDTSLRVNRKQDRKMRNSGCGCGG